MFKICLSFKISSHSQSPANIIIEHIINLEIPVHHTIAHSSQANTLKSNLDFHHVEVDLAAAGVDFHHIIGCFLIGCSSGIGN